MKSAIPGVAIPFAAGRGVARAGGDEAAMDVIREPPLPVVTLPPRYIELLIHSRRSCQ